MDHLPSDAVERILDYLPEPRDLANAATALQYGGKPTQQLRQLGREAVARANRLRAAALQIGLGRAAKKGTLGMVKKFSKDRIDNRVRKLGELENLWCLVARGSLGKLKELGLEGNQIGDAGMIAFADAIKVTPENPMGALGKLQTLNLRWNQIGDEGMKAFSDAIAIGSLGNLVDLRLSGNKIGDAGMMPFADAIKPTAKNPSGALAKLGTLILNSNQIGDDGIKAFSDVIANGALPKLERLWLRGNKIGDAGTTALAGAITSGALGVLKVVFVQLIPGDLLPVKEACEARGITCFR